VRQPRAEPLSRPRSERSREIQERRKKMELIEVLEKARRLYEITGKKKFEVKIGNKKYRFKLK